MSTVQVGEQDGRRWGVQYELEGGAVFLANRRIHVYTPELKRGFQYTNQTFHHKFMQAGMAQGMFRIVQCIDNGPMEGLCGILKQERYYGKRFTSKHDLAQIIHRCIRYYNKRIQRNLGIMTPMEKHAIYLVA